MIKVSEIIEQLPYNVVAIDIREIVNNSDPAYAEQRQKWIDAAYSLQQRVQAEVEKITASSIEVIDARHDDLVLKCRAARAAFDEINGQAAYFQNRERELGKMVTDASFAVSLKRKSTLTPTYSTKQDYEQWQSELDALVEAESTAMKNLYNHQNLVVFWTADCRKLKQAHDALALEESQLRNQLNRLRGIVTGPQTTAIGLSA